MLAYIEGDVKARRAGHAVVMSGGVGYKVFTTSRTLARLKEGGRAAFWTHLAVRENAHDLYGFADEAELSVFELLLTVSGIGPKSALAILDIATLETLRAAIAHGKAEYLTKVGGIGRKSAEKIVLELREKIGASAEGAGEAMKGDEEALEAMKALGYSHAEAREALRGVPTEMTGASERLREALKALGSGKA
ncbi:Holliday junction branch migration protein RuvA [Candidatus Kaiserbacteria bacterium CG10_big_fil_rev_8_21_14_0_10_59_10]|uniref:Holliday junction branch migration complex subunit RuvA n=1 Tax=Candidatus Kaiserbacteria bacterium CG10_big_fil_rev_8_21_14_0_10_59_10 TaxID=1974612 RepID=A0A2H0U7W0_9BACT|nr:MAG: Holliday junction branch migration protein RuvA [Candidatus Kaiserbacteria bacterium CG10_big_fil_rev_8_21_14_0_10_59_10]